MYDTIRRRIFRCRTLAQLLAALPGCQEFLCGRYLCRWCASERRYVVR